MKSRNDNNKPLFGGFFADTSVTWASLILLPCYSSLNTPLLLKPSHVSTACWEYTKSRSWGCGGEGEGKSKVGEAASNKWVWRVQSAAGGRWHIYEDFQVSAATTATMPTQKLKVLNPHLIASRLIPWACGTVELSLVQLNLEKPALIVSVKGGDCEILDGSISGVVIDSAAFNVVSAGIDEGGAHCNLIFNSLTQLLAPSYIGCGTR